MKIGLNFFGSSILPFCHIPFFSPDLDCTGQQTIASRHSSKGNCNVKFVFVFLLLQNKLRLVSAGKTECRDYVGQ